jgi:hypothetical protein
MIIGANVINMLFWYSKSQKIKHRNIIYKYVKLIMSKYIELEKTRIIVNINVNTK